MESDGLIIVTISNETYPETLILGAGIVSGLILGMVIGLSFYEHSLSISEAFATVLIVLVIASVLGLVAQTSQFGNKTMVFITYMLGLLFMLGITVLGTTSY